MTDALQFDTRLIRGKTGVSDVPRRLPPSELTSGGVSASLGKALEPLVDGTGVIQALVMLR